MPRARGAAAGHVRLLPEREMCCVLMIVLMIMLVPDTLAAVLVVDGLQFSERYARPLHS